MTQFILTVDDARAVLLALHIACESVDDSKHKQRWNRLLREVDAFLDVQAALGSDRNDY